MAQFSLPANSKMNGKSRKYPAAAGAARAKTFKVYRWTPDDDEIPRFDHYELDHDLSLIHI